MLFPIFVIIAVLNSVEKEYIPLIIFRNRLSIQPSEMKPARCRFHQDAHSTKMPVPPRCPFHQDARSIKMPIPPRCPFHNNMQRLITLANRPRYAKNLITYPSRDAKGEQPSNLQHPNLQPSNFNLKPSNLQPSNLQP
ncbi:MAG: hypothetical protein F6K26_44400 [Moorea sp. SIO2I5]|nr:hypothetical protein [Moorena sp. SIO2I5]